jgi:predicted nuclease of restriction endonuclease-like RecB superfamily
MLPRDLLTLRWLAGEAAPRYLGPEDEPWVRVLLDECRALTGVTARERDALFDDHLPLVASAHGATTRSAAAVLHVLSRFFRVRPCAEASPTKVRRVVFEEATAHPGPRHDVLERAARTLGLDVDAVMDALFADRKDARRVVAPDLEPSASHVVELHNLMLLQGLLLHADAVDVVLARPERAVVRYARSRSLLCACAIAVDGTTLSLSGPLASLRATGKYGHAFAGLVPVLGGVPPWSLRARCRVGERSTVVSASSADPLPASALPGNGRGELRTRAERTLLRELAEPHDGWVLAAGQGHTRVGTAIVFPDFALTRGRDEVPIEIVGACTPEYLTSRLRALEGTNEPLIFCVDDGLDRQPADHSRLLRYAKRIDPAALVALAERQAFHVRGSREDLSGNAPGVNPGAPTTP